MGDHKADRLREQVLTRGEISLAQWHRAVRHVMVGTALVLMSLSLVALHWALTLVGIPTWLAFVGALSIEVGMAGIASAATTIRKPTGRYYLSLWVIFSFLMALAQAANVGHALVQVSQSHADIPAEVPMLPIFVAAGAFAALFPLGGTLFIHVSGFLRVHGADAAWIDPDAERVRVRDDTAPAARAPRARTSPAEPRAQAEPPRARQPEAQPDRAPEEDPRPADVVRFPDEKERARFLFDRALTDAPGVRPDAAAIRREGGINKDPATVRRWVSDWWATDVAHRAAAWDGLADDLEDAERATVSVG